MTFALPISYMAHILDLVPSDNNHNMVLTDPVSHFLHHQNQQSTTHSEAPIYEQELHL